MKNHTRSASTAMLAVILLSASALACQVPVFRYALERWDADKYQILIISSGPLDPVARERVERLQGAAQVIQAARQGNANLEIRTEDISNVNDPRLQKMWEQHPRDTGPMMVVLYPRNAEQVPDRVIQTSALDDLSVAQLLGSPAGEQVAQRLAAGHSAVWIFVPCGQADRDRTAIETLQQRLTANREFLTVPSAEELELDPDVLAANKIPLRIEFSVVELDRNDPAEAFMLRSLTGSEMDLPNDQPLAFPVFGRGRVLYGLVGAGIMPETIDAACRFMAGPCSCQVKNQNPGFDLLLKYNWEQAVEGAIISTAVPDETAEPRLLTIPPGKRGSR
jgi:hypothetical protein